MSGDRSLRLEVILQAIDKATGPMKAIMGGSSQLAASLRATRGALAEMQRESKRLEEFRKAAGAVQANTAALEGARVKLRELQGQIIAADRPSKNLTESYKAQLREVRQLERAGDRLGRNHDELRRQVERTGVPINQLSTRQAELRRQMEQTNATINAQAAQLGKLKAAKASYDKTMAVRNQMAATGAGALAGGGAAIYAGARFAAPGLDFDEQMASVQALTRLEKTSAALAELREQARMLGATTSFTATQVASGQGFLAMAGFDPAAIKAAMPGMLALSKAGRVELAATADIASNILTGFKLTADQTGRLGDVLVGTFTRANVNLEMLGDTMKYVGPVAAGLGQDIETAAAMAGKLGDAGIQGSMAGTALRAILSRLAAPPKMAADAIESLGLQTKDAAGNMRAMPDLLAEIAAKTKSMGDAQRAGLFKAIAGEEAFSALSVLVDQAGSGSLQTLITTLRSAEGEASKNAKTMADNAKGDLLGLQSAWEDLGITVFETQNGPLRGVIQSITDIVRGIGNWARENPGLAGALVKIAAVLAVVVAGTGALLLAVASVLGPLAMVKLAVTTLGIAIGAASAPVLIIIGVIAALAAAAFLIYKYWEPIKGFFGNLWDGIKARFTAILDFFIAMPARFAQFGTDMVRGLVSGIMGAMGAAKDAITSVGSNVVGWFKDKLGIRSPSRVFAELGGFTMDGLALGLQGGASGPLAAIARTAGSLATAATVGMAGIGPAAAGGFTIDNRPPLSAGAAGGAAGAGSSTYNITINAAPSMNEQALARLVAAELDRRDRERAARGRSRLADSE